MRIIVIAAAALVLAGLSGAAFLAATASARHSKDSFAGLPAGDAAKGEVLFHAGGCASCHATTGQDDKRRLGGGLALPTAFGTFRAPNISPDPTHGIGRWTEAEFADAMLHGVGRNGEHLYPAFPYTSYQRMPLKDVRDLFAFLKTLPADPTPSGAHDLTFPFSIRQGLGLWKLLYLDGHTFTPDPSLSAELNRGAYLVEGPGHCAECHSPRNALGAIESERRFSGGPDPEGKGYVPNITPHEDGLAKWSTEDLASFLETGIDPDYAAVGGNMGRVIENTAKLDAADRAAMAAYLKSLPPRPGRGPQP